MSTMKVLPTIEIPQDYQTFGNSNSPCGTLNGREVRWIDADVDVYPEVIEEEPDFDEPHFDYISAIACLFFTAIVVGTSFVVPTYLKY